MKIHDNTDPAAKGRAVYTIQGLYEKYDDYLFDWETFYRDPERFTFTEDDIMYWNLRELKNYEFDVPMTPAEKRALRKWVASGHSVHEPRGSRYVFTSGDQDFLDVYRMDRELFHLWIFIANEGLQEEAKEFLKENMDRPSPFEE